MLEIFKYENKEVRTVAKDGQPWFVAKDLCDVLEVQNTTQALARLDEDERAMFNIGRQGETNIVNESGMYSLVLSSRKPEAKAFRKWVTSEVLPSIRKTGAFGITNVSQEDLIVMIAQSNRDNKNRLDIHENRLSLLEVKCNTIPSQVLIAEVVPRTHKKKLIDTKSDFISVKEFMRNLGVQLPDGKPQGIGRTATKICREEGIEIQKKFNGPSSTTEINLYPRRVLGIAVSRLGLLG